MTGEWTRPVHFPKMACNRSCFVCRGYKGEDLLTAARRCRSEDLEEELALGAKGDVSLG